MHPDATNPAQSSGATPETTARRAGGDSMKIPVSYTHLTLPTN